MRGLKAAGLWCKQCRAGLMNATAVAADRLMSCVASVVVVVLLPDEEWPTVVLRGTVVKQCSSVQDGYEVEGACARQ